MFKESPFIKCLSTNERWHSNNQSIYSPRATNYQPDSISPLLPVNLCPVAESPISPRPPRVRCPRLGRQRRVLGPARHGHDVNR